MAALATDLFKREQNGLGTCLAVQTWKGLSQPNSVCVLKLWQF